MTFAAPNLIPAWLIHPDDQKRLPNPVATALIESAAKRKEAEK
jgi:hypothetical protein